ncbi:kinase-like domain-containing protein [Aspergillus pseudotamarii]|uniref:Kinase-like domain-containing protein n=1 Tax=Aspergillus pseudotamarii TaxID=132259 RepID=A0A5N6SH55_ASPPS|nr:kinase-like domain-containing protein [Aspergillus pseudotamarii]KAE8134036.1 kinase-like domain-containing protein [Aspergillus pseudotamarii]
MADSEISPDTILSELSTTPYACSSVEQLSGGTANFVFRGTLLRSRPDGTTTVVIKHTEDYIASNREFKLSAQRCLIEKSILTSLNNFPSSKITNDEDTASQFTAKTPLIYSFNPLTHTQVMEDLPDSVDLKSFFVSTSSARTVPREWAVSLGRALGHWLSSFHSWGKEPAQADVARELEQNHFFRDLKFSINYDSLVNMVSKYPEILEGSRAVFEKVRDMAKSESGRKDGEGFGVIHGDFWPGNIILPKTSLDTQYLNTPLFIIDWELAQCGTRALDLGQMMAELYELKHYKDIDSGVWMIQGIMQAYPALSEEMAFRTLIHVGTHLMYFGSTVPGWGTERQIADVVRLGRDLIVKAWEKDKNWFKGGVWECLFKE